MKTLKLHIKSIDDKHLVSRKQKNYSFAYRNLFKQLEMCGDSAFVKDFKERFELTDIEFRSLKSDVETRFKMEKIRLDKVQSDIDDINEELETERNSRKRYKLLNKLAYRIRSLDSSPVFGSRSVLRYLTKECNKTNSDIDLIEKLRSEYKKKRILPFYVIGESNKSANRFFDFKHIDEGYCIYKPNKNIKCRINFNIIRNKLDELVRLAQCAESKTISISVRLSTDYIWLSFDEEKLNGFGLDEQGRRQAVSKIKSERHQKEVESELIKACYKSFYDEQRNRKLLGKNPNRIIAIDMNPDNIGCSIIEKMNEDCDYKIIKVWCYDFSYYFKKTGLKSSDEKQKRLNNKRKYELTIAVKQMFAIAAHYACSQFVIEELNIKNGVNDTFTREANRKNKNLWCRRLLIQLITRRCNETGIQLVEVNPCFTSFIGNIQHTYGDSCSASIEIARRGAFKYNKDTFYPHITEEDICTLESIFDSDAICSTICNWINMYKSLKELLGNKEFQHRLRTMNVKSTCSSSSLISYKSRINSLNYNTL